MRLRLPGAALLVLTGLTLSCTDQPTAPVLRPAALVFGTPGQAVISQVYGGGGNSGAPWKNDFVELFNRGGTAVSLAGMSIQYASATGTGNFAANGVVTLSGSLAPGQYALVRLAGGTTGATLPAQDFSGTINLSATGGKVILAATTSGLACNGGSAPCSSAQLAQIVDLVGFGGANFYEGSVGGTPAPSNSLAALRKTGGCEDTNDNRADFATGTPAPRNTASPVAPCAGSLPVGPLDHVTVSGAATVVAGSTIQLTALAQDANNQAIGDATFSWSSSDEATATVSATGTVTGVAASPAAAIITATATAGGITKSDTIHVTVTEPAIAWIDVSSSSTRFPPGFQTQLFATARTAQNGIVIAATFTFEAVDPQYATIQTVNNTGIVTGVAAPADPSTTRPGFRITATPLNGGAPYSFVTRSITIETPVTADPSIYAVNDEFGMPSDAAAGDPTDFLIRRAQYVLSYNQSRGTPNWVSYELDTRQMVSGQDRCNCFTADPALPAAAQILTSDYTNGGYDRGHLARSADRTAANVDNATTFYLTNIVPQTSDLNQGVWAGFENALADSARNGRAVYIVTGPLYSRGNALRWLKDEGRVAIPDSTWKVAVIGPYGMGNPFTRGDVDSWDELRNVTVLAVNMPNVTGVRFDNWATYLTTVDRIEAATGYDLLDLMADQQEIAVESGTKPPTAATDGPFTGYQGLPITMSSAGSSDPDGDALTIAWSFGDGTFASGAAPTHTYAAAGTYTVTVVATDVRGLVDTAVTTATVLTPAQGARNAIALVDDLRRAGLLNGGTAASLGAKLDAAVRQLERGNVAPAMGQLGALLNELDALARSGRLAETAAAPLRSLVETVMESAQAP